MYSGPDRKKLRPLSDCRRRRADVGKKTGEPGVIPRAFFVITSLGLHFGLVRSSAAAGAGQLLDLAEHFSTPAYLKTT